MAIRQVKRGAVSALICLAACVPLVDTVKGSQVTFLAIGKVASRAKFVLHVRIKESWPSKTVMVLPDGKDGPTLAYHARYQVEVIDVVHGPWPSSAKAFWAGFTVRIPVMYDRNGKERGHFSPILPSSGLEHSLKEGAEYLLCVERFEEQGSIPILRAEPLESRGQILEAIEEYNATAQPASAPATQPAGKAEGTTLD